MLASPMERASNKSLIVINLSVEFYQSIFDSSFVRESKTSKAGLSSKYFAIFANKTLTTSL